MNTHNPLVPQGSLLEQQQKSKAKSNLFIAVITILTLHIAVFGGLLIQGCKQGAGTTELAQTPAKPPPASELPPLDTNNLNVPTIDTNLPVVQPIATPPGMTPQPQSNVGVAQSTTTPPPMETMAATPPTTPAPGGKEYTVARGDSFYTIAKAHGVSVSAMVKANPNVDPKKLKVGQTVTVPAPSTVVSAVSAAAPSGTAETKANAYAVKPGDTLTRIAKVNGTSVKALRAANNLQTDRLHVGQKLKIPAKSAPAATDTTKPVETAPVATASPTGTPMVNLPMSTNAQ
jgi:LysM repeat protein